MFKAILVPLDGSPFSQTAFRYGLRLAKAFRAVLVGQTVVDVVALEGPFLHDLSGAMGFEPYLNLSTQMRRVLEERGRQILEDFAETCRAEGVPCESFLDEGIVSSEICERAKSADLIVMGQKGVNARFDRGMLGSAAEGVTRKAPKPVLVTPLHEHPLTAPLLAYDGSAAASKAMERAAEFAVALSLPLTVLYVGDPETGERVLDEARRYFQAYALSPAFVREAGDPHRVILSYAGTHGHDVLFMGAYGHHRIIEMVLGSTTEYLLRNASIPVFVQR